MAYLFVNNNGQYRDSRSGRFVSRRVIIQETEKETARLKTRLQGHTRLLLNEKITLREWEKRFAESLKESHIRMSALGAGGKDRLTNSHFGSIGGILRQEYRYLNRFAKQIKKGNFSEKYILNRASLYANSTRRSFYKGEQIARAIAGVKYARRILDPQAQHCVECPMYSTPGYVPIEEIVPPGQACRCGGKCRCRIIYRSVERRNVNLSDRLERILEA